MNIINFFRTNLSFCATDSAANTESFLASYGFLIIMVVAIVVMLIVSSRSNKKRQKQYQQMLDDIKPGSRVRTIGGIYGTISSIRDDVVVLAVGPDKVKLVFARGAISQVEDAGVENTMDETVKG